jgi:hypothetical protein
VDCGHCHYITVSGLSDAVTGQFAAHPYKSVGSFNAGNPSAGVLPNPMENPAASTRVISARIRAPVAGEPGLDLLELARTRICGTDAEKAGQSDAFATEADEEIQMLCTTCNFQYERNEAA